MSSTSFAVSSDATACPATSSPVRMPAQPNVKRVARDEPARLEIDFHCVAGRDAQSAAAPAFRKTQRQHAQPIRIRPVNPLEAIGENGPRSEHLRAFGSPIA